MADVMTKSTVRERLAEALDLDRAGLDRRAGWLRLGGRPGSGRKRRYWVGDVVVLLAHREFMPVSTQQPGLDRVLPPVIRDLLGGADAGTLRSWYLVGAGGSVRLVTDDEKSAFTDGREAWWVLRLAPLVDESETILGSW